MGAIVTGGVAWRGVALRAVCAAAAMTALLGWGSSAALAASPGPPTAVTATASDGEATVSFTPPSSDGGSQITGYTVTADPAGPQASGASSPITVHGLIDGTSYSFIVTAESADGPGAASDASAPVTPLAPPAAVDGPVITGTPEVDETLGVISGWSESGLTYSYQWLDCDQSATCSEIAGATGASYRISPYDGGFEVKVRVTATNVDQESTAQITAPTAPVTAQPGAPSLVSAPSTGEQAGAQTRQGSPGSWTGSPTSYAYQWLSCTPELTSCTEVGGDQASYAPTGADANDVLVLVVVASNGVGDSVPAVSRASLPVSFAPPPTVSITVPAQGADYTPIALPYYVPAEYQCSAGAGTTLVSCVGPVDSGFGIPLAFGTNTFTVTATDSDGQTASSTVTYTSGGTFSISVTSPVNGATYTQGSHLTANFACVPADGASVVGCSGRAAPVCSTPVGSPAAVCSPPQVFDSGAQLDTTALGQHSVTFTEAASYNGIAEPLFTSTVTYDVVAAPPVAPPPAPPAASAAPTPLHVGHLTQAASRWRVVRTPRRGHGGPPLGTTFTFRSSGTARVRFAFARLESGRRGDGRCIVLRGHRRHTTHCTRRVAVAAIVRTAHAGINRLPFTGVIGSRKLAPGRYVLVVTASSAGGSELRVGELRFAIVR